MRFLIIFSLIMLSACTGRFTSAVDPASDAPEHLKANLTFLASDLMQGRETATYGEQLAAGFISSRLKLYGLHPYGEEGYLSKVPFVKTGTDSSSSFQLTSRGHPVTYRVNKDFWVYSTGDSTGPLSHPLVFVRYGITDSSYQYDDYAGLDVKGKTVVMVLGEPHRANDTTFFKGDKPTRWSFSSRFRRQLAREKGAAGIIVLLSPAGLKQINMFKAFFTRERIALASDARPKSNIPQVLMDTTAAKRLMGMPDFNYTEMYEKLTASDFHTPRALAPSIQWHLKTYTRHATGHNIVALLPGTDPSVSDQYVMVSAHYDHLGTRNGTVYNGADDNGSGSVTILETARQLALLKQNRRPVLFVWFTGEEKGLLGSSYLTDHAPFIDSVMVDINMDMVGGGATDSIYVLGSGRINKRFYDLVEQANRQGPRLIFNYSLDDENDPQRIYYRSDHWNFAKKGIPIVFFFDAYMAHYHDPSDDVQTINFDKLENAVRLTREVALKSANVDEKIERGPVAD